MIIILIFIISFISWSLSQIPLFLSNTWLFLLNHDHILHLMIFNFMITSFMSWSFISWSHPNLMIRTIFFKVMFLFLVFSSVNLTVYFLPFSENISTLNQVLLKCIKLHLIMKEFLLQLNCIPHCTRSYTLILYKVVISGCIFVCQELLNRFASNFDLGSWESNINVLSLVLRF